MQVQGCGVGVKGDHGVAGAREVAEVPAREDSHLEVPLQGSGSGDQRWGYGARTKSRNQIQ